MIRLFLFCLLAIVIVLWLTLYVGFPADPGYLLIAFGSYTLETTLLALLVVPVLLYLLVRLLRALVTWLNPRWLVRQGQQWRGRVSAKRRSDTLEGLLCLARGDQQSAYRLLLKNPPPQEAGVINYLAAACAAFELGDRNGWMQCLEQAELEHAPAGPTIRALKAQLLYRSGQLEQCLAVLEQSLKHAPDDAAQLKLLKDVCVQLQDWRKLKELAPLLERNRVVETEELERIRMGVFMAELRATTSGDASEDGFKRLEKLWKKAPTRYRDNGEVAGCYADLLLKLDRKETAARVLETAISRNFSDALVLRYGNEDFGDGKKQLQTAEAWLPGQPANAGLMLSLGRICMRNELWDKAREYLETSNGIAPSVEACSELNRLLQRAQQQS